MKLMVTNIGTQTIETERLILRRFEYSDGALALGIFYPVQSQSTMFLYMFCCKLGFVKMKKPQK